MGVKVPGTKYSFWCERNIRGTNGTKREKFGEKYSGVNASKDIHRLVLMPLLCYLGCVLRVVVLLKGEPSPQSEVQSANSCGASLKYVMLAAVSK